MITNDMHIMNSITLTIIIHENNYLCSLLIYIKI